MELAGVILVGLFLVREKVQVFLQFSTVFQIRRITLLEKK